ncbi:MAG: NosD domain-containing protein [Planctomycetota bacterium]|nr:NosD domain-containing protein [Planctomycetota bacterium]
MTPESISEHRRLLLGALGVAGIAALTRSAVAGPLSPPLGPVQPTPGPEPRTPINADTTPGDATAYFVISEPGSYYMQRNLIGPATRSAIRITADNVTVDLNGFAIVGDSEGTPGSLTFETGPIENLTIRNGSIRSWGSYVTLNPLFNAIFEDLRIIGPYAGNLEASAQHSLFRRIVIDSTGEVGILAEKNCVIEDCVVVKREDSNFGLTSGIQAGLSSIVQRCVISGCGSGIEVSGGFVRDCSVFDTVGQSAWQIAAILIASGSVERCTVLGSTRAGIRSTGVSEVRDNVISACQNGITDGPLAGNGNRIEGNSVSFSTAEGIKIEKTRNIIARNAVTRSTGADYAIAPGNLVGEIIDGTGGASLSAATSAWANFRY